MSLIADTCARSHAVCAPLFFSLMYLLAPASVPLVLPCEQVHWYGPATTGDAVRACGVGISRVVLRNSVDVGAA
jgi:hypothetical protein